ncbi:MAG: type IV pilus modification protein PilV [Arhodomonas sp.]|nr:type IV pilus modification protein PilV [Arhodomonas sp.]
MNHRQRQKGFTLIEVLIAVVVLSVGLLGVLALQVNTLAFSHSAYLTSVASVQAMDLEERIRVNPEAMKDDGEGYSAYYVEVIEDAVDDGDSRVPKGNSSLAGYAREYSSSADACDTDTCNEGELVEHDIARWSDNAAELFPGNATVALSNTGTTDDPVYELHPPGGGTRPRR